MADEPAPAQPDTTSKPAKTPTRVRLATQDRLTRFVAPRFDGDTDLVIDHVGVSLPVKDAAALEALAADHGVVLVASPEKD